MDVDPIVRQRQFEWQEELDKIQLENFSSRGEKVFAGVTDKFGLAAIWLYDAICARSIDFPQSDFEMTCHRISRSRTMRFLYNFVAVIQIILPFMATSGCGYTTGIQRLSKFIIIDVISLVVYVADIFFLLIVNFARKSLLKKPWTSFRILCCALLFLEVLGFSNEKFAGVRVVRCLFPFFLVSRRTNLQRMFQGLYTSGFNSLVVIRALISVLVLWAFVGFLVFRNISSEAGNQRFDSIPEAMFATLHCFTSRPFCLLALKPFFAVSQPSAVFFVTLTLAADILCIGLIVAIGTQEYKAFAANTVTRRLSSRKFSLLTIFHAFAVQITPPPTSASSDLSDDGTSSLQLSREVWIELCGRLRFGYQRSIAEASIIFAIEDEGDSGFIAFDQFVRCVAMIASKVVILVPSSAAAMSDLDQDLLSRNSQKSRVSLSKLLADKSIILTTEAMGGGTGADTVNGSGTGDGRESELVPIGNTPLDETILETILSTHMEEQEEEDSGPDQSEDTGERISEKTGDHSTKSPSSQKRRGSRGKLTLSRRSSKVSVQSQVTAMNTASNAINTQLLPNSSHSTSTYSSMTAFVARWWAYWKQLCLFCCTVYVIVELPLNYRFIVTVRSICSAIAHILLVIQLCYLSFGYRNHSTDAWFRLGIFLETYFWFDMILKMSAWGLNKFLAKLINRAEIVVNAATLISLVCFGVLDYNGSKEGSSYKSTALQAELISQSFRFFGLFFMINDIEIFERISPIIIRALFIYFSVIYFFAIFAHGFFCSSLDASEASGGDDDASNWINYSSELNFSTYLQSVFTLFEMSILANWSIVMDAAARVSGPGAYIFFYIFRLSVTLNILPLLLGFVMQAYLGARKAQLLANSNNNSNSNSSNNSSNGRQSVSANNRPSMSVIGNSTNSTNSDNSGNMDDSYKANQSVAPAGGNDGGVVKNPLAENTVDRQSKSIRESFSLNMRLGTDVRFGTSSAVAGAGTGSGSGSGSGGGNAGESSTNSGRVPNKTEVAKGSSGNNLGEKKYSISANVGKDSTSRLSLWNPEAGIQSRSPNNNNNNSIQHKSIKLTTSPLQQQSKATTEAAPPAAAAPRPSSFRSAAPAAPASSTSLSLNSTFLSQSELNELENIQDKDQKIIWLVERLQRTSIELKEMKVRMSSVTSEDLSL